MAGPNVLRATASAKDCVVRVGFAFPVGASGEWGWSATLSPDVARTLAAQLLVAADSVATHASSVRATTEAGTEPATKSHLNRVAARSCRQAQCCAIVGTEREVKHGLK